MTINKRNIAYFIFAITILFLSGCKGRQQPPSPSPSGCSLYHGNETTCNIMNSNGQDCAFDSKTNQCVNFFDCTKFNADQVQCDAQPSCSYYTHATNAAKNRCFSSRNVRKQHDCLMLSQDMCELQGMADVACVYVSYCRPASDLDARGFTSLGQHRNGTFHDDHGFNSSGFYRWSTNTRDPNGFDRDGYDIRGFNRNGRTATGDFYDSNGFNQWDIHRDTNTPYARDGFNRLGYDAQGFNRNGFNASGKTIFGHDISVVNRNFAGLNNCHRMIDNFGNFFLAGPGCPDAAERARWQYSTLGIDPAGYLKILENSPADVDEAFNRQGYNAANQNFLQISKHDFDTHGFNAILTQPAVAAYPNDLGQLVNQFNNSCFQLAYYDLVDDGFTDLDGNLFFDRIKEYQDAPYESINDYWPLIKELRTNVGAKTDAEITTNFINYLKKSIYFCDHFLYAGNLDKANSQDFTKLAINHDGGLIKDEAPQPNYEQILQNLQASNNIDFMTIVTDALTAPDVLNGAVYTEQGDRDSRGVNADGSSCVQAHDVRSTIGVYSVGGFGKDFHRSRLMLRLVAEKMATATLGDKQLVAGEFAHGGAHCADAKRKAVQNAAVLLAQGELEQHEMTALLALGVGNMQIDIKRKLYTPKLNFFENWIVETMRARGNNTGDQLSGLSATWNSLRNDFGLPLRENAHHMPLGEFTPGKILRFFQPSKPATAANYPELGGPNGLAALVVNGGFTKELVYVKLFPRPADPETYQFKKIMEDIFGPLWILYNRSNKLITINPLEKAYQHPIMQSLLVRLGLFNVVP